ncbi:MAG: NifB/NifX family molybdenum-iron cluster-binding protein [Candidatus Hodarchaeota archaeon]
MVIVAVPSSGSGGLNELMFSRFGRCPSFTFITVENDEIREVKTFPNPASDTMGGAGIQAAQIIANNEAEELIVGLLGPNAAQSLNILNIKIYQAPDKELTIKEAINLYLKGKLQIITSANVGAHQVRGGGKGLGFSARRDMGGSPKS